MSAAAEYRRPARDRKDELSAQLEELNAESYTGFRELAAAAAQLWEVRDRLNAILRTFRSSSAWQLLPETVSGPLDSYWCDGMYNLHLAYQEIREAQGALTSRFLEISGELSRELYGLYGFTPEQIEEAMRPVPDPAELERQERAAAVLHRRATEACPHGVLLSNWREPCQECRQEREAELARAELEAMMNRIRSNPVQTQR